MFFDNTNNGVCSCCGNCCSNWLPLSKQEKNYLSKLIKDKHLKPTVKKLSVNWYDICPFLDDKNKCSIYEQRPQICKNFKCDIQKKMNFKEVSFSDYLELCDLRKEIFRGDSYDISNRPRKH